MWGFTTTCDNFLYEVNIWNKEGTGEGNITSLPLFGCYTNSTCTVEAIEAEAFPWPANLTTVSGSNYLTVKKVNVWVSTAAVSARSGASGPTSPARPAA